jgi:hypothetical protein
MSTKSQNDGARSGEVRTAGAAGQSRSRTLIVWQVLSALFLLGMGWIHLDYVLFLGAGGVLGILFSINAVGALVLAIAMIVMRQRLLGVASVLSVLFMVGTLLSLILAMTVSLFGITEQLGNPLVVPALVVESIGTVVLVVTSALVLRTQSGHSDQATGQQNR